MKSILIPLLGFLLSCGGDSQRKPNPANSEDVKTVSGHCEITQEADSLNKRCIDYYNLTEDDELATKNRCQSNDLEKKVYQENQSCSEEGRLGGCKVKVSQTIAIITWIYATSDPSVDDSLVEIAKENCSKEDKNGIKGDWLTPSES